MAVTVIDSDGLVHFRDDTHEIVIKSGLSGVAATVLAVALASPAGLGGMIGTSLASGADHTSAAGADALANLAPYPAPISASELATIRTQLAEAETSLETLRSATDADIEHIRSVAGHAGLSVHAATREIQAQTVAAPAHRATSAAEQPQHGARAVAISYVAPVAELTAGGGEDEFGPQDPDLQLADLLLTL